uniref:RING-type E3 ubiquitin transferase n=1 Tax=Tetraodon nigroviridis TaxID=99883 RepID=H3BVS1_TETNG
MLRRRPGERQEKPENKEAEEEEALTEEPDSRSGAESPLKMRADRRVRCRVRRPPPPPPNEDPPSSAPSPKTIATERRVTFRRRNVMSLSDADGVCLICYNDLSKGTGGTTELQCSHSFHKECIQEWLWRKQFCPTCHLQVSIPQPVFWSSTRVKVP